jgi:acetylglutamate kinase
VTILIKIGGTLLDSAESRNRLAAEIARAADDGQHIVVVHGGGKQMTRFLAERGIESRFVNGLRVTTPEVLDGVLKVLAGSVNQELVAAFVACGANAVGLSGMDALITEAEPMSGDLGSVGKPVVSHGALLDLLMDGGYLPVVACLAGDAQGRFYNVNADQMAASIAGAIGADKLLFLTDVDGVRGEDGSIYSSISLDTCGLLIDKGVATGGMRTKLDASVDSIRHGVREVVIAPGARPDVVRKLVAGEPLGTRVVAEVGARLHG